MHAVIGQPSSWKGISLAAVALAAVRSDRDVQIFVSTANIMEEHSHDPPRSCSTLWLRLRI
jgi:hypothetical protein